MRKLLFFVCMLALAGCSQKKWDKDTLVNDCLRDFTKKNEEEKLFNTMQLATLCNCVSDKLLVKYKSARESDKDEAGVTQIGQDCAMELRQK